jgi:hypothetical protein
MVEVKDRIDCCTISSVMRPHVQGEVKVTVDSRVNILDLLSETARIEKILDGFALIEPEISPRSLGVIGVGNGIEMIGAAHIFQGLDRFILAEPDPSLLRHAHGNLLNNAPRGVNVELRDSRVNLLAPLATLGQKVDLLYVNLLNAPFSTVADPDSKTLPVAGTAEDDMLNGYLLGLPYHFLRALPEVLNPGGSALMLIAARFPFAILDRLAAAAEVRFEELACGFDLQSDAAAVLPVFAAAERENARFYFYHYGEAKREMYGNDIPTAAGTLARYLASTRLSARLARDHVETAIDVAYIYHLMRVTPIG